MKSIMKKTKPNMNDRAAEPITVTAPIPANIWHSELEGLHELAMLTNRSFEELLGDIVTEYVEVSLEPSLDFERFRRLKTAQ